MNILLIGESMEDHITFEDMTKVKPGGVFYSVLGLKSILKEKDRISLCTSISVNRKELFSKAYDDIDKSLFNYVSEIPVVKLNISRDKEREEKYSFVNQNLLLDNISDFNIYDGILINMITGFDITLEQLRTIRSKFNGNIFFDVHTLARGFEKDGTRNFRVIPGFEQWVKNIDLLQVNETEFSYLFELENEKGIIIKLFSLGIKILLITKGKLGSRVFYRNGNEIISCFISSLKTTVKNKVGCGDIFGAIFFYSYICNHDIENALRLANKAAGIAVMSDDLSEKFERFRSDVTTGLN